MISKINSCIRCLYDTSHPLGLIVDQQGLCSGCKIHEEKDKLDWNFRLDKLKNIVKNYKSKSQKNYDCIIPVTGANDNYYIVHIVKNILELNPLLVCYNKYFNTPLGIRNLANLRIKFNCDILIQNVNPINVKKITQTTIRELGSVYWHVLAGHTVFPVQTAVRYKIPLIIWGAHQGLEQVGMFSHKHEVEMSRRYRKDHDLMSVEPEQLISIFDNINEEDIHQYLYPDDLSLNNIGVRGIYLGNYIRWDPKAQHEKMIKIYNYLTSSFSRTFDHYDYTDCYVYMDLHDKIKIFKHGYSKVTDHACREIRHGRLSREAAINLVKKHRFSETKFEELFCNWLGIKPKGLNFLLDQIRNEKYWYQTGDKDWKFIGNLYKNNKNKYSQGSINFINSSQLKYDEYEDIYITVGKGYP